MVDDVLEIGQVEKDRFVLSHHPLETAHSVQYFVPVLKILIHSHAATNKVPVRQNGSPGGLFPASSSFGRYLA
jgi:hypothetical protein